MSRLSASPLRSRRRFPLTRLLALPLAVALFASPASAQPPSGGSRPDAPATPATDRAAVRAEAEVARSLARLDEDLALESYPDVSPLWPARMAAAIEAREPDAPGQALLLRLAAELRALGATVPFGAPEDDRRGDLPAFWQPHPSIGAPAGRERAQRIVRIRELVEQVDRKLGFGDRSGHASREKASAESGRIGARISIGTGGDDCASPVEVGLGYHRGYTSYATNDGSSSCEGPTPSPDVWLRFTAPEDGTYTFRTVDPGYDPFDTVLSLHSGCPTAGDDRELTCSDDAGSSFFSSLSRTMATDDEVLIRIAGYDGASGDYDLVIELGRKIEGTVARESDGVPLAGITVEVFSYWGDLLATTVSRADGSYTAELSTLEADEVFVRAGGSGYLTEIYQDLDCVFGTYCNAYYGDELDASAFDLSGIDFTLLPGGTISGSVRSADGDEGLDGYVYLYESDGTFLRSVRHDLPDGAFEIENVPAGTYYLRAQGYGHRQELWDDIPCGETCDPTAGTPFSFSGADGASGLDFVLDPLGAIEGTVSREGSGEPAANVAVYLHPADGAYPYSTYSKSDGTYRFIAVSPEYHHLRTSSLRYHDELYEELPCEPTCEPTDGAPVRALVGQTASGIDFTLAEKATLSGTVTAATTSEPLQWYVRLYDTAGSYLTTTSSDTATGEYTFYGLDAGSYHVLAVYSASYSYPGDFEPQLYQGEYCDGCDVTSGTPVAVATDAHVTGIDFQLTPRGSITGTVTDFVSGEALEHLVRVQAYSLTGQTVGSPGAVGPDGSYEIRRLLRGDYRVGTVSYVYDDDHLDEMWNDVACALPCDRTTGHTVTVRSGVTTAGVDFALRRLGRISGDVFDTRTGYRINGWVSLFDATGQEVASTDAWYDPYVFGRVPPGTYYVRAEQDFDDVDYQREVYPDVPCDPDCDPTLGTPIVVTYGSSQEGVDFHLTPCPAPSFGDVVSSTVSTYMKVLACQTIRAENATVGATGDLLLRAGEGVVFGDGFSVETGGSLRVVIEPEWADD